MVVTLYKPLDCKKREIRLIRLHAAADIKSQISCDVTTVSLNDNPVYEALSYVWGNATKDCQFRYVKRSFRLLLA